MKTIAGYSVLSRLGTGARSTIYAVQDDQGQVYALKHVVRNSSADERFIEQAVTEHDVASSLDHPSLRKSIKLIRQRALLRTKEIHVLMEFVDGKALSQFEPMPVSKMCAIFIDAAKGLAAMHKAGYVHADFKPNNLVVTDEGVKIIDFGQSCAIGSVKPRIQGTPDYIAPEQVMKMKITPRTDIFNLGASIYHTLTGKPIPTLVPAGTVGGLAMKQKLIPPQEINDQTPPALSSLVMACIEKDPSARPSDMKAVIARLDIAMRQSLERQSA